jgi:hypothetical protein
VRVRPVPEVGVCYVYTPAGRRLYTLNIPAWLILEMCEGRSPRALAQLYEREMDEWYWSSIGHNFFAAPRRPSTDELRLELESALRALQARGIIELKGQPNGAQHGKKA